MLPFLLGATDARQFDQNSWIYVGLGFMLLIYMFVVRPMMRKKKDPLERGPNFPTLAQQRSSEREMQSLLVEFSEMARQMSAQLDTRSAKLEELIRQADERIERLNGAPLPQRTEQPTASDATETTRPAPQPPDPRHADVYSLADQGRDPYEIAASLGKPRGEVELILALRRKDER